MLPTGSHKKTEAGCWEWQRSLKNGYGQWKSGRYVHRAVFQAVFGALLPGELVRHTCDNRRCVRPSHLRRGDKRSNFEDFRRRGDFEGMRAKMRAAKRRQYNG
jgi:hypothetical protein